MTGRVRGTFEEHWNGLDSCLPQGTRGLPPKVDSLALAERMLSPSFLIDILADLIRGDEVLLPLMADLVYLGNGQHC